MRGGTRSARRPVGGSSEGPVRGRSARPPARQLPAGRRARAGATRARSPPRRHRSCRELADRPRPDAHGLGDHERAGAAYTESAELARAGGYTWILAVATDNLGDLLRGAGRLRAGESSLRGSPRTLPPARRRENGRHVLVVNLGILAAREGRNDEAEALLRQSLECARALVDKELAIWCLRELPALAVSKGDAERAARLTGAMETLREETGHVPEPDEQRLNEQTRNALASELGEEHLAAALAIGREMTFEQAVTSLCRPRGSTSGCCRGWPDPWRGDARPGHPVYLPISRTPAIAVFHVNEGPRCVPLASRLSTSRPAGPVVTVTTDQQVVLSGRRSSLKRLASAIGDPENHLRSQPVSVAAWRSSGSASSGRG